MNKDYANLASRLQGVIDTAIDGIITIDDKGIVESINKSAAEQFCYSREEIVGKNIKMLMPEPYHSKHDGYLHRYNETKEPHIIGIGREVLGKKKDGKTFPFRLAVSEVILNDRIIYTGIIHDLTDIKEAEQRLRLFNEELEEKVEARTNEIEKVINKLLATNKVLEERESELKIALNAEKELNELKSRFVSMASHEFRTPLSTIMSSASLIGKYVNLEDNEKRTKHINRIKSAVNNLTGILNDFLSLSKIEEGKVILNFEQIELIELCDLVVDELKGLLKKGQKIQQSHNCKLNFISDKKIVKNILFNLLSNAIKYSGENSIIECSITQDESNTLFKIVDKGLGIPENEQKNLFERFFRASNVENIQGTGLGLNIVRRYVHLLNGTIGFESILGQGTTFFVSIPKRKI